MNVHTYEKIWLVASLFLIVGFIATVVYGAAGAGIAMVDASGGTVDSTSLSENERFGEPGVERVGDGEYEVTVVARQFMYQPDPIRVPADSRVTFYVTSADVIHGFQVVGTNVNTMVIPGQVAKITVDFDEPAEYGIICNEYCGQGHHDMEGKLVVVPEDEYGGDDA